MTATKTKSKTKKKESDYAPVFKLIKGLAPNGEVWVENEPDTDTDEELNRIGMAVRRGPIKPRKGYKWGFRFEEATLKSLFGFTVVFLRKIK